MEITVRTPRLATLRTPLLAVPAFGPISADPVIAALDELRGGDVSRHAREERFKGTAGQTLDMTAAGGVAASRLAVLGLDAWQKHPAAQVRTFAHKAGNLARTKGLSSLALVVPASPRAAPEDVVRWLAEGMCSGVYRFERYRTGDRRPEPEPRQCVLVIPRETDARARHDLGPLRDAVARGKAAAEGVALARDLVNEPANELGPEGLAERARQLAERHGLEVSVLGAGEIAARGLRLLEAVSSGSARPPRFIHLVYRPSVAAKGRVALVGKGITFDSGGLSLKTGKAQQEMKCDMAGAAVVLGTLSAAAALGIEREIHGIVPATDNMPGGNAVRPGDVVRSYQGTTVEVLNTDAEGRLILADALAYAAELEPEVIIDHATLTAACMVALGPRRAGVFASDSGWANRYVQAARRAGEAVWHMPLAEELRESLKSDVADVKNIGGSWGGAITAALFLREFVKKVPWVHVDIAGPAFLDKPHKFHPKGGTGFGVLTLLEMLRR
jgi:leucyl aminopeptidase